MRKLLTAFALLVAAPVAFAQSAPPPAPTFTVVTQPVMWRIAGSNEAATDAIGTFKLPDPDLALRTDNFIAPNPGISANFGGIQYAKELGKSAWQGYVSGGVGLVSSNVASHFGADVNGGLNFDIASSKTFSWNAVQASYIYGQVSDGGKVAQNSFAIATGIKISF